MKKEKLMKAQTNGIYQVFQDIKDLEIENIISNAKFIEKKCGYKCLEIMEKGDYIQNNKKGK